MKNLEVWQIVIGAAVAIIVPVLIWRSDRRKAAKDPHRQLLDQFLNPLDSILKRNKTTFDALVKDHKIDVHQLEFYPSHLKTYFQQLPATDLRRNFWMADIDRIHNANQDAIKLIHAHEGNSSLRPEFKKACSDFVDHAQIWKSRWDYALASTPIAAATNEQPIASTFPQSMDRELPIEIARISALAGVKPQR